MRGRPHSPPESSVAEDEVIRSHSQGTGGVALVGRAEENLLDEERPDPGAARLVLAADLRVEVKVIAARGDVAERRVRAPQRGHQADVVHTDPIAGASVL